MGYTVSTWCSHPDAGNDDCNMGADFATKAEAFAFVSSGAAVLNKPYVAYILIDGPDVHEVHYNAGYRPSRDADGEWRRELAMQAGMAFGCEGYNDVMG